jgi:[protein-PII] uridylyltransferase
MSYPESRAALVATGLRGEGLRRALSAAADEWLVALLGERSGVALVAVGGYGRGELSPGSDLDVVLLHDGFAAGAIAAIADSVWYPIWDTKVQLDHSVRTVAQARAVAREDLPVALGLLTARHVAGDPRLTDQLRSAATADWRARAARRLPEVQAALAERLARHGELAYRLEGDLKEAKGGLRDAYALTAISASWLADVPHGEPEEARARLLDVRDALHIITGRSADRLLLQEQDAVAAALGLSDADALLGVVADAARTISYASDVAWRQVDQVLAEQSRAGRKQSARREPLADGVVAANGEANLALSADPRRDLALTLRAAAAAALAGLPLSPAALGRLAREAPELPSPWPGQARDEFVRLLGSGPGLIPVWEALDRTGLLVRLLPEWSRLRSLPQRNALHIHTVDRHLVQTAVHAAERTRKVSRPDLLLVAALCHDLGKGLPGDHSEEGVAPAALLAARMGFSDPEVSVVAGLVRHHLLLAQLAVHRDPDDPATVDTLVAAATIPGAAVDADEFIGLLHALTEADSEATGPAVWSKWRAGLMSTLVDRARLRLAGRPVPSGPSLDGSALAHRAAAAADQLAILVMAPGSAGAAGLDIALPDKPGVLALVAGVLSLRHIRILSAEAESVHIGNAVWAVQRWTIAAQFGDLPDLPRLRTDLRAALAGRLDLTARIAAREGEQTRRALPLAEPTVTVHESASHTATLLEVRAHDGPGLLHRLASAITAAQANISSARVSTLGAEAIDVFYLVDGAGRPLTAAQAEQVVELVGEALGLAGAIRA